MYNSNHSSLRKIGLLGTFFGSLLVSLSAIHQSAAAQQQTRRVNPCPGIFYEEPYRNRVLVPLRMSG